MKQSNSKKFLSDLFLNSVSNVALVVALQLLVYPFLGRKLDEVAFGEILFTMAIVNILGVVVGNSLGVIALRQKPDCDDELSMRECISALNVLFLWAVTFAAIITLAVGIVNKESLDSMLAAVALVVIVSARAYSLVGFRLILDYRRVIIANLFLVVGYIVGLVLFSEFGFQVPIIIFLSGEIVSFIYILKKSTIFNNKPAVGKNIMRLLKDYILLMLSSLSVVSFNYADRVIVKYALGISSVPILFSAGVNGRILGLGATSITSVALSHLAHTSLDVIRSKYVASLFIAVPVMVLMFMVVEFFTPFIINLLYPKYFDQAMAIHLFVNIGFAFKAFEMIYRSLMLRLSKMKNVFLFDSVFSVLYISLGIFTLIRYGLREFVVLFMVICAIKVVVQHAIIAGSLGNKTHCNIV